MIYSNSRILSRLRKLHIIAQWKDRRDIFILAKRNKFPDIFSHQAWGLPFLVFIFWSIYPFLRLKLSLCFCFYLLRVEACYSIDSKMFGQLEWSLVIFVSLLLLWCHFALEGIMHNNFSDSSCNSCGSFCW